MQRTGKYLQQYLSDKELLKFVKMIEKRITQIEEQIREIGKRKLGREEVKRQKDTVHLIYHLHKMDQKGELPESLIKDELQSYDLLQNDRY